MPEEPQEHNAVQEVVSPLQRENSIAITSAVRSVTVFEPKDITPPAKKSVLSIFKRTESQTVEAGHIVLKYDESGQVQTLEPVDPRFQRGDAFVGDTPALLSPNSVSFEVWRGEGGSKRIARVQFLVGQSAAQLSGTEPKLDEAQKQVLSGAKDAQSYYLGSSEGFKVSLLTSDYQTIDLNG